MTLSIVGSPTVSSNSVATTAALTSSAFTPALSTLLLTLWSANSLDPTNPATPSITDTSAPVLAWTRSDWQSRADSPTVDGQAATYTAAVRAAASMTVTVTNGATGNRQAGIAVITLGGADLLNPVGAHNKSGSTSTTTIAQTFTATRDGSMGFIAVCDWFDAGAMTAGTGCTLIGSADVGGQFAYGFIRRTAADGVKGSTTTMNVTLGGNSTAVSWAYIEILPELTHVRALGRHRPPSFHPQRGGRSRPPLRTPYWFKESGAGVQVQAEAGSATVAARATGAAVKVAIQGGTCGVTVRSAGSASKVAVETASASVAVRGSALAAKVALAAGSSAVAARSSGVAVNSRVQAGSSTAVVRATALEAKVALERGSASIAVRGTSLEAKVAPQSGSAQIAVTTTGFENTGTARAQTGSCGVAVRASGAGAKVAIERGSTAVAVRTAGQESKTVARGGTASVLVRASGNETSSVARPQTGAAAVLVRTSGSAGKTVARGGTASIAVRTSALGVKVAPGRGSSSTLVRAAGLGVKRAVLSGQARIAVTANYTKASDAPVITPLGDRLEAILNQLISYVGALGIFQGVQGHEPKGSPRNGLTAALWLQAMVPAPGASGLDSTSLRVSWYLRIYQNFLSEPQDSIDPKVMKAMAAVMEALTGNFDLDIDGVRAIDVLGAWGVPMGAEAGYLPGVDGKIYRCMTLTIPVIVDDAFVQVA